MLVTDVVEMTLVCDTLATEDEIILDDELEVPRGIDELEVTNELD